MTIAIDGKYKNIQKKDKYLIWCKCQLKNVVLWPLKM